MRVRFRRVRMSITLSTHLNLQIDSDPSGGQWRTTTFTGLLHSGLSRQPQYCTGIRTLKRDSRACFLVEFTCPISPRSPSAPPFHQSLESPFTWGNTSQLPALSCVSASREKCASEPARNVLGMQICATLCLMICDADHLLPVLQINTEHDTLLAV